MANTEPPTDGMQRLLTPLFEAFKNPDVAIALAFAILTAALAILLWFVIWQVVPALRALRRVKAELRLVADHNTFSTSFPSVDEAISREALLKHGWEEFKKTLVIDENGPIRNTARPSTYLNIGSVSSGLRLPLFQAMPNYFVGIGLLFTFLGLVAAIHFASEGVAGDVSQAKAALGNLLTAATFKFTTSIAGLLSSLVLSICMRQGVSKIQSEFEQLSELLEQRMVFVTPESLAVEQINELKKQSLQLERFNTDFAVEVAKALEEKLNTSLGSVIGSAVAPMVNAIEGMATGFNSMNQDAMAQIVGEFKDSIQGAAGTEMVALAGTLSAVQAALTETISAIKSGSGTFGDRVETAAQRLEEIMSTASTSLRTDAEHVSRELSDSIASTAAEFQRNIARIAELWSGQLSGSANGFVGAIDTAGSSLSARMDAATEKLGGVIAPFANQIGGLESTLRTLDGRLRAQVDGLDGSIAKLSQFMNGMDRSLSQLRDAGAPIAQTADKFSSAARQVEATALAVKGTQDKLTEIAKTVEEGARLMNQSWESYRQRFEKVDVDLSATFSRLQEGTDAYHHRILEYVKEVDGHFTNSLRLLGGGVEQLNETIEDLVEATAQTPGRSRNNFAPAAGR